MFAAKVLLKEGKKFKFWSRLGTKFHRGKFHLTATDICPKAAHTSENISGKNNWYLIINKRKPQQYTTADSGDEEGLKGKEHSFSLREGSRGSYVPLQWKYSQTEINTEQNF